MPGQTLIGLDVGTTSVKAIAITPDGEVVGRAEEQYELQTPQPGWAEQDPEDWWRAAQRALARLEGAAAGIGLSGQMHGLVCSTQDRALRPAILWNDQRTGAECAEIERRLGLERLIALTGNRALTGFTAPKLLWLRTHEPEIYGKIAHICLPKDYVRLRLTGEHATDVADASGTLLFDVAARDVERRAARPLEVPSDWLPRAWSRPRSRAMTTAGAPRACRGRRRGRPGGRRAGSRRGQAGAALGGARHSGVVFAAPARLRLRPQARLHVFCHAVPAPGTRWG